jgi:hypothetical protein
MDSLQHRDDVKVRMDELFTYVKIIQKMRLKKDSITRWYVLLEIYATRNYSVYVLL